VFDRGAEAKSNANLVSGDGLRLAKTPKRFAV
jgi:hypothetical protein